MLLLLSAGSVALTLTLAAVDDSVLFKGTDSSAGAPSREYLTKNPL